MNKLIPWLIILAAPMAMLFPLWGNPVSAGEDDVMFFYPTRVMVGQALRAGQWPLADALEGTGAPLMADPQAAVLHPATWLFAIISPPLAYSLSIFIAFSLAGAGAYLYLRTLSLARAAALLGALAFMFCGFMVGHRVHLSMIMTAAMLPWMLWCIEQARSRPGGAVSAGAPILFLAIAAGHWPTLIQMMLVCGAYFLLRARPLARAAAAAAAAGGIALLAAAPQVIQTVNVMRQSTRMGIGYATFGENSFFPLSAVLGFFPMFFGSRTPNGVYAQAWWGPWHLCETLGYIGLITVVLAGSAVWRLYRKPPSQAGKPVPPDRAVVRVWTWIGIGAIVWMLGYYLPTYRLVHLIPGLNMVRCPSRMLLAVDMALAALAAVAVSHILVAGRASGSMGGTPVLRETVRRAATWVLPAVMLGVLAVLTGLTWATARWLPDKPASLGFMVGWVEEAIGSLKPHNPALWAPLAMVAATIAVVWLWLKHPGRRIGLLVVLLLADLFTITAFVDVPGRSASAIEPPAAAWLRKNDPGGGYRIWSLPRDYADRPVELLRPRSGQLHGFATINAYGPLKSPVPSHVFGFGPTGETPAWSELLCDNYLLSAYGVKYILAAEPQYRRHIESVVIPAGAAEAPGPELLTSSMGVPPVQGDGEHGRDARATHGQDARATNNWQLERARLAEGRLVLECSKWTPVPEMSQALQAVPLEKGTYRMAFDARGPQGGAAHFLRAELFQKLEDGSYWSPEPLGMTVPAEQIGPHWRHFEAGIDFEGGMGVPPMLLGGTSKMLVQGDGERGRDARDTNTMHGRDARATVFLRLYTMSERPIEVRNISLRSGSRSRPVNWADAPLKPGEAVYRLAAEVQSLQAGQPPVAIYENRLCRSADKIHVVDMTEAEVEAFRHRRPAAVVRGEEIAVPRLGPPSGGEMTIVAAAGGPAAAMAFWAVGAAIAARRNRRTSPRRLS